MAKPPIRLQGVRQNNLKNIHVEIPARQLTVVTGLSGSGKSSLAFDTLYAEGQRRYVESLSTYTRQFLEKMPKPELDSIQNIPPAIALEQKNHIVNSRSTVGSQTEIVDYLRLLFAKVGRTFCIDCGNEVKKVDAQTILDFAVEWLVSKKALIIAPLHTPSGSEDAEPVARTKKSKSKASKKPSKKVPALASDFVTLAQTLKEQGFRRLYWRPAQPSPKARPALVDLDDIDLPDIPAQAYLAGELYVVVDRLRLEGQADAEIRARLLDSIDQAIAISHGKVGFVDLDAPETAAGFKVIDSRFACLKCGREHVTPEPNLFASNNPIGACPGCSGFGHTLELDENLVVRDPSKTLKNGAIDPFSKPSFSEWQTDLFRFAEKHGISVGKRYRELTAAQRKILWDGVPGDKLFPGIRGCFEELKRWKYKLHIRVFIRRYQNQSICLLCKGTRLRPDALAVKVGSKNIAESLELAVKDALTWVQSLELGAAEKKISKEIVSQVERRLLFLNEVGVGYLALSRLARTLSGGEFQRINLATQIGNGLCGTLYVLDEPSIGLHAADTDRLIRVLHRLRDQGNTVVVVEHDLEVMRSADYLIELGPGAGRRGGELVAQGSASELIQTAGSVTGKYLSGAFTVTQNPKPRSPSPRQIRITGCREHNLKNLDVKFPLDRFVVVTGVSGSGKSTLVNQTLYRALSKLFYKTPEMPGAFDKLYGAEQIAGVVMLDQTPIGKSSRSNPATYLKAWDEIRRIYANQVLALRRGYTPQHFSFNVDGGRCPVCKGEGEITLDMHFMAEVKIPCEECEGKRFKRTVLDVTYRGRNVFQLLNTTIDDAYEMFRDNPVLLRKFGILRDVGLGYLQVGQSATTLSGGESQRLKIAATLDDRQAEHLLYIFDEPTTGLHLEDVKKLLQVAQDLVAAKHSVLMIEHHLDVIAQADWVIDLGPTGGQEGGNLMAAGTPQDLMENPASITGQSMHKQGYHFPPPRREGGLSAT